MSPRRDSTERAAAWTEMPEADGLVDGKAVDELLAATAGADVRGVLTAATRALTRVLGERGSCILLEGQPRVVVAPHTPSLHELPIDLERYPEVRAAAESRRLVAVDDVRDDARLASVRDRLPPIFARSWRSRSSWASGASASSSCSRRAPATPAPSRARRRRSWRA